MNFAASGRLGSGVSGEGVGVDGDVTGAGVVGSGAGDAGEGAGGAGAGRAGAALDVTASGGLAVVSPAGGRLRRRTRPATRPIERIPAAPATMRFSREPAPLSRSPGGAARGARAAPLDGGETLVTGTALLAGAALVGGAALRATLDAGVRGTAAEADDARVASWRSSIAA
jgi:hypothetical protein